jgi:predicted N-formylglutamate amidohydrolase
MRDETQTDNDLLSAADPPAFTVINEDAAGPVVLACDHASNAVPASLDGLGLLAADLEGHIAWDAGAAEVTRLLAARLDARCVLAGYSRLVIDCNRAPDHETSIPVESDGLVVPGNVKLSAQDRTRRQATVFHPYHSALAEAIDAVRARGQAPVLIAVHSFTPVMDGFARPWHVAVLWAHNPQLPLPLMAALRARGDLVVGDNQPYSGREQYGYTMDVHAGGTDIPHALIEIRADQIAEPGGIARYAGILTDALGPVLAGLTGS